MNDKEKFIKFFAEYIEFWDNTELSLLYVNIVEIMILAIHKKKSMKPEVRGIIFDIIKRVGFQYHYFKSLEIMKSNMLEKKIIMEEGMCDYLYQLEKNNILNSYQTSMIHESIVINKPHNTNEDELWWTAGEVEPRINWIDKILNKLKKIEYFDL